MKVNNINQTESTDSINKSIEGITFVSMTIDSTSISTGMGSGTGISIPWALVDKRIWNPWL